MTRNCNVRVVPFREWPVLHQKLYEAARRNGLLLEGSGQAAHWGQKTDKTAVQAHGLFLDFLHRHGRLDPAARPSEMISLDALRAYVAELQARVASETVASYLRGLSEAVRVMEPEADRELLKAAVGELEAIAEPAVDRISPLVGPSDLYLAGIERMTRFDEAAPTHWRPALAFMDGLMMSVWTCKPLRLGTFALTEIGTHLQLKNDRYDLVYGPSENKTYRHIQAPLPEELTPWIERWLAIRSEVLEGGVSSYLWVTRHGTAICDGWLYHRIRRAHLEEVGLPINPHRIRKVVATGIAVHAPECVDLVQDVLDHSDPEQARRAYILAGQMSASLQYLEMLKRRRGR